MPRELRGSRYLTVKNEPLARFIVEELHFLEFDDTIDWYAAVVPSLEREDLALLGCNDRFFLLTGLCHRVDAIHPWLFNRCREVENDPDGYLDLWARYHYKSSIGTFAGIVQEIVCDPEVTVAIMSCTNEVAKPFLVQIQQELELNETLKEVYSDVLWQDPRREAPKWSKDEGIIVRRKSNPKEATVEAFGVIDGMKTGKHYRLLNYDDLVTEKLVTNVEMVQKVTERYELSDNLGQHRGTRKWHWGTRYSFGDTYGILLERGTLIERRYPATDNGKLDGKPIFLTQKRWDQVKDAQRSTVHAQMLLNPLSGKETMFKASGFRPFQIFPAVMNVYIIVDPSKGRTKRSDRTAIAVIGVDDRGNRYLIDGACHRMKLSERWTLVKSFYQYWSSYPGVQSIRVGYEVYGAQTDDEYFKERMEKEAFAFELVELNWVGTGSQAKPDRIERLEPDLRNGRFYLPAVVYHPEYSGKDGKALWSVDEENNKVEYRVMQGLTKLQRAQEALGQVHRVVQPIKRQDEEGRPYDLTRAFMEEALFFPFAPHDDLIDAVSRIYDEKMEVRPAVMFEQAAAEQRIHPDS
jgi:hypothetical protein